MWKIKGKIKTRVEVENQHNVAKDTKTNMKPRVLQKWQRENGRIERMWLVNGNRIAWLCIPHTYIHTFVHREKEWNRGIHVRESRNTETRLKISADYENENVI